MEWNGEGGGPPLGISLGYYQENSCYFRQPVAPSPTPDKWNQIVVENLKKSMDIGFWQSPTSNLNKNTIKKSTIYIPPSFHDICLNLYDNKHSPQLGGGGPCGLNPS